MTEIRYLLDNDPAVYRGDPDDTLLSALRRDFDRRSVRTGCEVGECGACTVLVDGQPTASCITPVATIEDASVATPDGLGDVDVIQRVRAKFLELQAAQCGYCLNGIIMTVAAELRRVGSGAQQASLTSVMDRNICRCGTHVRLLQAASRALEMNLELPGGDDLLEPSDQLGTCRVRTRVAESVSSSITDVPPELEASPDIAQWLRLRADGRIDLLTGRAEFGQGVHLALSQIAAAQLGVPVTTICVRGPSTGESPDEGYTSGSKSLQQGGLAVAIASVAFRRALLERAGQVMGIDPQFLHLRGDSVAAPGGPAMQLSDLYSPTALSGPVDLSKDQPRWDARPLDVGARRPDLEGLTGSDTFVHDMLLPGMLHARAVLPPSHDAKLDQVDDAAIRARPDVEAVIVEGRLIVVVATSDSAAAKAASMLAARTRWAPAGLNFRGSQVATLEALERHPFVARDDGGVDESLDTASRRHSATYSKPFQAHGSMAPSCAVALRDEGLTIWTHTQGAYPMREEVAAILGEPTDAIKLVHMKGPGCYGQNLADDAAVFAAIAANEVPGRPVRFQFTIEEEFAWDAYGSAMSAVLTASMDEHGEIVAWRHRSVTDTHTARPRGQGNLLAASWLRAAGGQRPWRGPTHGGARNIRPLYEFSEVQAVADHVRTPLRTGSLRALGAFLNLFAIESFMDELAELNGVDPLHYRMKYLTDARAQQVLEEVAELADWEHHVGASGRGQGIALTRYNDTMGYVAMIVDAHVDLDRDLMDVHRISMAADAGTVINPEGLRQQLEGAALQGLSRTLIEELRVDGRGVHSRSWSTYPVLAFSKVPRIDISIIDRRGSPPLGIGEAATPVTPPSVANAIYDGCGIRLRDLPLDIHALQRRLLELDESEAQRIVMPDPALGGGEAVGNA